MNQYRYTDFAPNEVLDNNASLSVVHPLILPTVEMMWAANNNDKHSLNLIKKKEIIHVRRGVSVKVSVNGYGMRIAAE